MRINVLFFAQLRDIFGASEKVVNLSRILSVAELRDFLFQELNSGVSELPLRFVVNECLVEGSTLLSEGDTVAFLPPVSGG